MKTNLKTIIADLKERQNKNREAIKEIRKKIFTARTSLKRIYALEKQAIKLQDKADKIEIKDILKKLEDFEAELLEKCRKCEEKPGTPVYCECGLPCYSITIKEILKGDLDGPNLEQRRQEKKEKETQKDCERQNEAEKMEMK